MTPLGKSFAFYFNNQPEMLRLYWQRKHEPSMSAETIAMVNAVGDRCCQEVGQLLGRCGKVIETHVGAIANLRLLELSSRTWRLAYGVWPKEDASPSKKWPMRVGVDIPRTRAQVVPWVWASRQSSLSEFKAICSSDSGRNGKVTLARIPIPTAPDFVVDGDELLRKVDETFAHFVASRG